MSDKTVKVTLTASVDGYISGMGKAAQATLDTERAAQSAGKRIQSSLGSGLASSVKAGAAAFTAATAAVAGFGVAAIKAGAAYNGMQQASRAALTTILGGAEKANAQMDALDKFAKESPFAKQVFIQAQQQLLGFGLEAQKVVPTLDAIQNSVAAVGGSNEDISNVTDALAKMMGSGKLAGDTLNRLGMYGIDAASIIGESMGMTGAEIRAMASKPGGIPADHVFDVLIDGLQEKFGGAAENVKQTWVGATDRIKGAIRDIGSNLAEPFVGHKGGGLAIEWVNKFADLLRAAQKQIEPIAEVLLPRMSGTLGKVTPMLERAADAVKRFDPRELSRGLDRVSSAAPGLAAASAALLSMGGNKLGLDKLGLSLNPVAAGLMALVSTSPEARKAVMDLLDALSPLLPVATDLAVALAAGLSGAVGGLGSIVQAITPLVSGLASGIGALAGVFDMLPGGVQTAIVAFALLRISLGTLQTHITGPTMGAIRSIGDQMRLQAALAQMEGRKIGGAGALISVGISRGVAGAKAALRGLTGALGGPWGIAIMGAAALIGKLADSHQEAKQKIEEYTAAVEADSGALGENTRTAVANSIQKSGAADAYKKMGGNLEDLTKAALGELDAIERVTAATKNYYVANKESNETTAAAYYANEKHRAMLNLVLDVVNGEADAVRNSVDGYRQKEELLGRNATLTADVADAADEAAEAHKRQATGLGLADEATKKLVEAQSALAEAILAAADAARGADNAEIGYYQALDKVKDRVAKRTELEAKLNKETDPAKRAKIREELAEYAATLDVTTKAGQDNLSALIGMAERTEALAKQRLTDGDAIAEVTEAVKVQRAEFIKQARQFGINKDEAEELADRYGYTTESVQALSEKIGEVPKETAVKLKAETEQAATDLALLQETINKMHGADLPINMVISAVENVKRNEPLRKYGKNAYTMRADGGPLPGVSAHDRADDHLFLGTAGEWVIRRPSVRKLERESPGALDWINRYGKLPRFADGGQVGFPTARAPMQSAAPIDYGQFASAVKAAGGLTVNVSGPDPHAAAREVIAAWQWEMAQ